MSLSNQDVQEILRLLDDLDATELHLRTRHFSLSLRRDPGADGDGQWSEATSILSTPQLVGGPPEPEPDAAPADPDDSGLAVVRAPLAGTFYRAPKPGAAPFVEVGSLVKEETVVGIVETMKLMNSVCAGQRGRVAEVCLANAAFAAQGAVLMRIAPE